MDEEDTRSGACRPRWDPRSSLCWEDPIVTGVLPVALEDATKIVQAFLHSGKEYVCLMVLHDEVPDENLRRVLDEFTGEIHQKPPLRASVKHESRKRTIYYIDLLERDGNRVLFKVGCQAGTYIRKLCSDIGEVLGAGAHMQELRRTRSGPFTDATGLHTLHELVNARARFLEGDETTIRRLVRPVEEALEYIPKICVRDSAVDAICHGAALAVPGIVSVEDPFSRESTVAIMTLKGEAVALATSIMSSESMIQQEKGIAAKVMRVIMPRGTYPRMWRD
jgi:H/ACA ribonucleoprotein complex subunit 4